MTKAELRKLWEIQASGTACPVNLAAYLKAKAPRRKPQSSYRKAKETKRLIGKMVRSEVRAACVKRAGGRCECTCGARFGVGENTTEFDHFHGRARAESIETCWMLTRECHRLKTENAPRREYWDREFMAHCWRYGYPFKPRLTKGSPATPPEAGIPPPVSVESAGCVVSEEVTNK